MSAHDDQFKRQLAPALDLWVSEELISAQQATRLRDYYALDAMPHAARGRFGSLLLAFGAILIGLGIITFVAANWDAIPRSARAIGGLVLMVGLDAAGFRLWQRPETHRFGSALLLAGGFTLGANIALMAQWFQIGGSGWGLFLGWSVGTFAMALGLRHGLIGALSCLTFLGVVFGGSEQALFVYPWVFAGVFGPLAVWCDSRTTLYAALVGLFVSTVALATDLGAVGYTVVLALDALLVWSCAGWLEARLPLEGLPGRSGERPLRPDQDALRHALAPRMLAIAIVLVLLEAWAFREPWHSPFVGLAHLTRMPVQSVVSLAVFLLVAVGTWGLGLRRRDERELHGALGLVVAALVGAVAAAGVGEGMLVFVNGVLLLTVLALAWLGLARADRRMFWYGMLGLTFQVFARFLEYDTALVAKSIVFTLWGMLLIGVGWWFERTLAERAAVPARG